jgi:glycosyltransferase involved in cell wall biosynthesis
MRIVVYDNSGHPFQVQLSRELAKQGNEVLHLYSASFQTPKGRLQKDNNEPESLCIKGITLNEEFEKYSYFKRWNQEKQIGKLAVKEIDDYQPNVLIASNVPLDTLQHISKHCQKKNIRIIFWVQDFYGIAIQKILKKKMLLLGDMIGQYYISLEKKILETSNHIVLIADDFRKILSQMRVRNNKFTVIPNWSPIEEICVENKDNAWSRKFSLHDKFCFIYTGTLGLKHNPQLILDLALTFQKNDDVRIVVVSEGIGAEFLIKKKMELRLNNLIILSFQSFDVLPKVMGTADVLISILEKDAGIFSVPSKILTYLCAQRALLVAVPAENLSAKIVSENNCGIVVEPDKSQEFIASAEKLYMDKMMREKMGVNARMYAETHFTIDTISQKFSHIINNL